jgi:hypothetical protein
MIIYQIMQARLMEEEGGGDITSHAHKKKACET